MSDATKFREETEQFLNGHWIRERPTRSGRYRLVYDTSPQTFYSVKVFEFCGELKVLLDGGLSSMSKCPSTVWWWSEQESGTMPDIPTEESK